MKEPTDHPSQTLPLPVSGPYAQQLAAHLAQLITEDAARRYAPVADEPPYAAAARWHQHAGAFMATRVIHAAATEAGKDTPMRGESTTPPEVAFVQVAGTQWPQPVVLIIGDTRPLVGTYTGAGLREIPGQGVLLEPMLAFSDGAAAEALELARRGEPEDGAACARCGCTEDAACPGGCSWVATPLMEDLCSACVDQDGSCTTPGCGVSEEQLADAVPQCGVPPYGSILVHVYGATGPRRWYCSPLCAGEAIERGGAELAAADRAAELAAADSLSRLADDLDTWYGAGAEDEHAALQAEAMEEALAAETVYDPTEGGGEG